MEKFGTVQRTQIVKFDYQNQGSIIQTQRAYQRHLNVRDAPSKNAIKGMVKRFEDQGAVSDLPRSGRRMKTKKGYVKMLKIIQQLPPENDHWNLEFLEHL